jgi:hypothetical protein
MEASRKHLGKGPGLGLWKPVAHCAAFVLILALCLPAPVSSGASPGAYTDASGGGARPQALPELLFNQAAGLAGLPGLAPRLEADQGLSGGPSEGGRRASAYMRFEVPSGYGLTLRI